jgi:hypothetical protein
MPYPKSPSGRSVVDAVRDALPVPSLAYYPTDAQRELKASFWLAHKKNPLVDDDQITPALVESLTGVSVQCWLSDDKFWSWFSIRDSVKLNLEVAAERASELAMHYMDPSIPFNDNARVQLIKYVLEFAGRAPPLHKVIKWGDKAVADMSENELADYIRKHTPSLPAKPSEP